MVPITFSIEFQRDVQSYTHFESYTTNIAHRDTIISVHSQRATFSLTYVGRQVAAVTFGIKWVEKWVL